MLTILTTTCFFIYIKKKIDEVFFTYSVVVGKTYSHFVHFCSKVDSLATQLFLWIPLYI